MTIGIQLWFQGDLTGAIKVSWFAVWCIYFSIAFQKKGGQWELGHMLIVSFFNVKHVKGNFAIYISKWYKQTNYLYMDCLIS